MLNLTTQELRVIERSCSTQLLKEAPSTQRTEAEIIAFVKEVLPIRFDTEAEERPGWLSSEEEAFRSQEQQELSKKEMSQRVLVNTVRVQEGARVLVEADRLIAVGKIKTVLKLDLVLTIATVRRSESNPYGLRISQVKAAAPTSDSAGVSGKESSR